MIYLSYIFLLCPILYMFSPIGLPLFYKRLLDLTIIITSSYQNPANKIRKHPRDYCNPISAITGQASTLFNNRTDWQLDKSVFNKLLAFFGQAKLDVFASRLNRQLPSYVAWIPDPDAMESMRLPKIELITIYLYMFPSFSVIAQRRRPSFNSSSY